MGWRMADILSADMTEDFIEDTFNGGRPPTKAERDAFNRKQRIRAKAANDRMRLRAIALLEQAGFVFHHQSPLSESRYYYFPGRESHHLRVSCHRPSDIARKKPRGETVAFLTFNGGTVPKDERFTIEGLLHSAIGRYMVATGSRQRAQDGD